MLAAAAAAAVAQAQVRLAVLVVVAMAQHQTRTQHRLPTTSVAAVAAVVLFQFAETGQMADLVLSLFRTLQPFLIWHQLAGRWYLPKQPLVATRFIRLPAVLAQFLGNEHGTLRRTQSK
jgi:hypothetical protein